MTAPGDTLNPLYQPKVWPGGRAPAIWEVERLEDGRWKCGAFLWVGDEPALQNDWTGSLWWAGTQDTDFLRAMRWALRAAHDLERERDELLDGINRLRAEAEEMLA